MELLGVLWIALFCVAALIFLVECLEQILAAGRRWCARGHKPLAPTFSAGFSLRRPDSVLRERHRHKVRPDGRLIGGINKSTDDPYSS